MYPTNLTEAQWQSIEKLIPKAKRKRKYELRKVWNAIMYVVKTGCQWRMIPNDFPKWQIVYYYFRKWTDEEIVEEIMHQLREQARKKLGKNEQATVGIIDSQSVRSNNNRAMKGVDGGKKVKGRKRHIIVDTNGWLLAVLVHAANLHYSTMAGLLLRRLKESLSGIKVIYADGGYRGELIEKAKQAFGYIIKVVMRKDTSSQFKVLPKRWIVERTNSWFDNDRRLSRDVEYLTEVSESMVHCSAIKLLLRKI